MIYIHIYKRSVILSLRLAVHPYFDYKVLFIRFITPFSRILTPSLNSSVQHWLYQICISGMFKFNYLLSYNLERCINLYKFIPDIYIGSDLSTRHDLEHSNGLHIRPYLIVIHNLSTYLFESRECYSYLVISGVNRSLYTQVNYQI